MFRRIAVVAGIIAVLMLSAAPVVESTNVPVADRESSLDEPRHIPTVKPHGPYRLILPKPSRITANLVTDEPPSPVWTNNVYVIKAGDTLSKLIPFLGHSVNELARCSGIANPHRISIGQKLHKPGTCVAPPKPVAPAPVPGNDLDHTIAPASGIAETVIAFAMAQLGDPYVWGGNGPNSWDCSGIVHAAFRHAGISTTRSTKTLINEGSSVGHSAMVRGDIVFTDKGHVGIYIGNNQMIHAPQTGDVVKISTLWSFYAARRIG